MPTGTATFRILVGAVSYALSFGIVQGEPLPFNDGQYVTDTELCFLDEDQLVFTYTDSLGRLIRRIEGSSLTDGYEMYCEVSKVARIGDKVTFEAHCDSEGEPSVIQGSYTWLSDNAFRVYGQTFRRCGSEAAISEYSDHLDADSGELVSLYDDANSRCRGGDPSDPKNLAACGEREEYGTMLEAREWCFGQNASAGFQSFWAPCNDKVLARSQ